MYINCLLPSHEMFQLCRNPLQETDTDSHNNRKSSPIAYPSIIDYHLSQKNIYINPLSIHLIPPQWPTPSPSSSLRPSFPSSSPPSKAASNWPSTPCLKSTISGTDAQWRNWKRYSLKRRRGSSLRKVRLSLHWILFF